MLDWVPTPADVGGLLRSRTKDRNGREVGTFNQDTRPTDDQVNSIIEVIVTEIESMVGGVPEQLQPRARWIASVGSAAMTELTQFQEQVANGRSPYKEYKDWYDDGKKQLRVAVAAINDGGDVGVDTEPMPSYSFPNCSVLTGYGFRY